MLQTPLCREMGIEFPIFSVGMSWLAGPELAAAVSNAGGCGVVGMAGIYQIAAVFANVAWGQEQEPSSDCQVSTAVVREGSRDVGNCTKQPVDVTRRVAGLLGCR